MHSFLFYFAQFIVVLLVLVLLFALWSAFRVAYVRFGMTPHSQEVMRKWKWMVPFIVWLLFLTVISPLVERISWLTATGVLLFVLFFPLLLFAIFVTYPPFRRLITLIPLPWLVLWQVNRLFLELIYWMGFQGGFIPFQLSFTGLNLDVIVGITAPLMAYLFYRSSRKMRFESALWNGFGLLLHLNFYLILFLSLPSDWQVFTNKPVAGIFLEWPFIWIPGVLGPISIAAHILAMKRLDNTNQVKK